MSSPNPVPIINPATSSVATLDNVLKKHRIIGTYRTLNKRLKQIKKIPSSYITYGR